MAISNYDITAAAFRPEGTHDYELSILTGMDSFAYIIRDQQKNELLAYRSLNFTAAERDNWPESFNRLVQADDKLRSLRYGNSILGWEEERLTLVPDELFDAANPRVYLEQLTLIGLDDVVRSERFNELGGQLLFAADRSRIDAVERRLHTKRTHHMAGGVLTAWGLRSRRLGHRSVSALVRGNQIFLAAHQNGNLQFFNTFPFANAQDALYYLLLVYQQCGWAPSRVPLYLCGEITEHSDLYRQFYRYVEDLRFCQYGAPPSTPPELAGLPGHLYFELLCLG
ncbi:DUF3822 family protein [Neolewinella agarilytica]|uniref:DUF3822 domain-containing protein n=1 Tax=Neolewinella agarilytica TaxID=478744 RepID=A0A1H9LBF1_9BACT|nr:DUF3822 family protein [Neolewinella agarilytica]SER08475.1 Protein of unknown function [Neolewinella agarilytica]